MYDTFKMASFRYAAKEILVYARPMNYSMVRAKWSHTHLSSSLAIHWRWEKIGKPHSAPWH